MFSVLTEVAMGITLKIRKFGNSMGVTLPKEMVARLKAKEGDELFCIETKDGYAVAKFDPEFAKSMELVEEISDRFKNAYRELAKR
jgi:antitoxin MazE